jgi:excisionase family DNA binding protein
MPKKQQAETKQKREGFATVREVSEYLRISKHTIYRMINDRKLPVTIIGTARRIEWSAIYALHRNAS